MPSKTISHDAKQHNIRLNISNMIQFMISIYLWPFNNNHHSNGTTTKKYAHSHSIYDEHQSSFKHQNVDMHLK